MLRSWRGRARPRGLVLALVCVGALGMWSAALAQGSPEHGSRGHGRMRGTGAASDATATPIKHVIVIIGENHSFDNVFATYQPPRGQTVRNLLSEGIVTASGDPGPQRVGRAAEHGERHHGRRLPDQPHPHRGIRDAPAAQYQLCAEGM